MTVEEFLSIDFPSDKKFELVDGVIEMMAGGSRRHAEICRNLIVYLSGALKGSGCQPLGSDAGLRVNDTNLRYPDVAIYCGGPSTPETDGDKSLEHPRVIFEVLSASTKRTDERDKLDEYRSIETLDTVILVDPVNELTRVVQRLGPTSWRDDLFAQPHDVELPSLGVTIPHDEIFARD